MNYQAMGNPIFATQGGFPTGYRNPYQDYYNQVAQQQMQQQFQPPQAQPQQGMTPPTIHAEIIQLKSEDEVDRFPVNAGTSQLFQLADDTAFIVKSVLANGEAAIDVYEKRPRKPVQPTFDPALYVTRDELEKRLAGLVKGKKRDEPDQMEIRES